MPAKVILNPYSARWSALKRRGETEAALQAAGIDYHLEMTDGPDHAVRLAAGAVRQGYNPVIAAGGDGTIGEVVNGLMLAKGEGHTVKFGVMPLGTANDLVNNIGLPLDLSAAAQVIASGITRQMDLCKVNDRYFANNAGLGLEPYITTIQERMTRVHGVVRYLLATLVGIAHNPQWHGTLAWDGSEYHGPLTLISVGNSPLTGGIFYTVPHADAFDGKLTFVYGHVPTRLEILQVLPRLMKPGQGNYTEHPAVYEIECTSLRVHLDSPTPAHTDGEIFDHAIQDLEYSIAPACLPILVGE